MKKTHGTVDLFHKDRRNNKVRDTIRIPWKLKTCLLSAHFSGKDKGNSYSTNWDNFLDLHGEQVLVLYNEKMRRNSVM